MSVLGLLSHLVLVFDLLLNPEIPFASPIRRGRLTASTIVSILIVTFIGTTLTFVLRLTYATVAGTTAMLVGLAALNIVGRGCPAPAPREPRRTHLTRHQAPGVSGSVGPKTNDQ